MKWYLRKVVKKGNQSPPVRKSISFPVLGNVPSQPQEAICGTAISILPCARYAGRSSSKRPRILEGVYRLERITDNFGTRYFCM